MKHLKHIIAAALTVLVAFAMAVPALAAPAGDGTITIKLPTEKQAPTAATTYEIYKVFDATVDAQDNTKVSYTLANGELTQAMKDAGFSADAQGNVTFTGAIGEAQIAAIKEYAVTGKTPVDTVTSNVGDTQVTSKALPFGYYYITTTTGSVVTIDTNNNNVAVEDKNIIPTVKKSAGTEYDEDSLKAIAAVGTDQEFTAVITKTHGATKVVFKDEMTNMTYNGDLVVKVGGATVDEGTTTFTVSGDEGDATFTVTFVDSYIASLADDTEITLSYSGKVTSAALSKDPATNKATLTSGNGNSVESKTVEVYNAKISVNKVDGDKQPLAGAKFKLKNADGLYYAGATADADANWTADGVEVEAVEVTAEDGTKSYTAVFQGLADGTYTLEESTVPKGYNKAADQTITIAAGDYTVADLEKTATVENQSGAELPSTGGMGTTVFYVVGGLMVASAAVMLITKKRMGAEA